jgi:hypothetical protein
MREISRPPSAAELRAGRKMWGSMPTVALSVEYTPAKPKMRIISGKKVVKGTLRFVCKIGLPFGGGELEIADVMVFSSPGKSWASLPSKPVLDSGVHETDENGKKAYAPFIEWSSKELRDRFSAAVVELVQAAHPDALDGAPT